MHQSKKEILAQQWNQKFSLDIHDQIEKDELILNRLLSREIGIIIQSQHSDRK